MSRKPSEKIEDNPYYDQKGKNEENLLLKKKRNHSEKELIVQEIPFVKRIDSLIKQYSKSLEYFKKIENYSMAEDSRNKLLFLKNALKSPTENKNIDLPDNITPDYICGCTSEERKNTFNLIIKNFKNRMKKFKDQNKDITNLKLRINQLEELSKNEFVPVPLHGLCEEEKEEKINYDIEKNSMKINIDNYLGVTENMFLKVYLNSAINCIDTFLHFNDSLKSEHSISIKEKEFKLLYKDSLSLDLFRYRKHCCWPFNTQKIGKFVLPLKSLESSNEIKGFYNITAMTNSQRKIILNISIKIRNAILKKEFINQSETYINILKIFPPFSLD